MRLGIKTTNSSKNGFTSWNFNSVFGKVYMLFDVLFSLMSVSADEIKNNCILGSISEQTFFLSDLGLKTIFTLKEGEEGGFGVVKVNFFLSA